MKTPPKMATLRNRIDFQLGLSKEFIRAQHSNNKRLHLGLHPVHIPATLLANFGNSEFCCSNCERQCGTEVK